MSLLKNIKSLQEKEVAQSTFSQNFQKFKIIVVGTKGSGKHSFCKSWLEYEKPQYKSKNINILFLPKTKDNYEIEFDIIHFDPKNPFKSLPYADGYILFFGIDDALALDPIYNYLKKYFEKYPVLPIILVGNKSDSEDKRNVQTITGLKTADTWKCSYVETSCVNGSNIGYCIEELVKKIEDFKKKVKIKDVTSQSNTTKNLLQSRTNDDELLEALNM
jgi:GTPase SAR1 family protein